MDKTGIRIPLIQAALNLAVDEGRCKGDGLDGLNLPFRRKVGVWSQVGIHQRRFGEGFETPSKFGWIDEVDPLPKAV